jgi:excisionase family DNA binding protein
MRHSWPKAEGARGDDGCSAGHQAPDGKPDEPPAAAIATVERDQVIGPPPERPLGTVSERPSGPQLRAYPHAKTEPTPPVLTVDELAALLRVNRKTVYDALSRGEIPGARRIGSTYRILRDAVLDWLASGQDRVSRSRRNR